MHHAGNHVVVVCLTIEIVSFIVEDQAGRTVPR